MPPRTQNREPGNDNHEVQLHFQGVDVFESILIILIQEHRQGKDTQPKQRSDGKAMGQVPCPVTTVFMSSLPSLLGGGNKNQPVDLSSPKRDWGYIGHDKQGLPWARADPISLPSPAVLTPLLTGRSPRFSLPLHPLGISNRQGALIWGVSLPSKRQSFPHPKPDTAELGVSLPCLGKGRDHRERSLTRV